ncbi:MAG: hypothetical protein RI984_1502 [Pseudomonadota bacterium]
MNSHVITSSIALLKKLGAEYSTALLFVLIWSTGFIVAKLGLPFAPTLTFLSLRYVGVLVLLVPLAILMRADWPKGHMWHIDLLACWCRRVIYLVCGVRLSLVCLLVCLH